MLTALLLQVHQEFPAQPYLEGKALGLPSAYCGHDLMCDAKSNPNGCHQHLLQLQEGSKPQGLLEKAGGLVRALAEPRRRA